MFTKPCTRTMTRPLAPTEPSPEECCQSGCDPCVFDRYNDELRAYYLALAQWEQAQLTPPPKPEHLS